MGHRVPVGLLLGLALQRLCHPSPRPDLKYGGPISSACKAPGCGSDIATAVPPPHVVVDKLSTGVYGLE